MWVKTRGQPIEYKTRATDTTFTQYFTIAMVRYLPIRIRRGDHIEYDAFAAK
jgi:hypothetical protein